MVRGEVGAGPFEFLRREVRPGILAPRAIYAFDGATVVGADLDLTLANITVQGSVFDDCRFTQRPWQSSDGTWSQGTFGRRPTTFRRCVFEGVQFRALAGFRTGDASFEDCTFQQCTFTTHLAHGTSYVRCRFEGRIDSAAFYGTVPDQHPRAGERNRFEENDFTAADLGGIELRGGIDPSRQHWSEEIDPTTFVRRP